MLSSVKPSGVRYQWEAKSYWYGRLSRVPKVATPAPEIAVAAPGALGGCQKFQGAVLVSRPFVLPIVILARLHDVRVSTK